jgi:hypothetical protein
MIPYFLNKVPTNQQNFLYPLTLNPHKEIPQHLAQFCFHHGAYKIIHGHLTLAFDLEKQ